MFYFAGIRRRDETKSASANCNYSRTTIITEAVLSYCFEKKKKKNTLNFSRWNILKITLTNLKKKKILFLRNFRKNKLFKRKRRWSTTLLTKGKLCQHETVTKKRFRNMYYCRYFLLVYKFCKRLLDFFIIIFQVNYSNNDGEMTWNSDNLEKITIMIVDI